MKRNEMIKKIEEIILNTVGVDPDTGAIYFPNLEGYLGSRVLNTIEENGMLPPSYEFKMGDSFIKDNCWEPEND